MHSDNGSATPKPPDAAAILAAQGLPSTDDYTLAPRRVHPPRRHVRRRRHIDDYQRMFACGLRGALVWDEGVLDVLNQARTAGDIPTDAVFKVSVYTGHANPAS